MTQTSNPIYFEIATRSLYAHHEEVMDINTKLILQAEDH